MTGKKYYLHRSENIDQRKPNKRLQQYVSFMIDKTARYKIQIFHKKIDLI
jgi:hypothetical protein